ncbi:conserved hypothetical protein [Hyphomicrobiales bacterium]|nr:conserved hypothetical protein [Hyphomicrobiales bacterium]CAH1701919.1 conserved hypothetical protein [Hyphomicrobiales bacterium]CAI0346076.1 conserved hypothetical protein [Hyphomicrobiales bacterium]
MDDLDEAGLDLERDEFGKRLDSLLVSRGWNPKAGHARRSPLAFSVKLCAPNSAHVTLDAILPEAVAREITALVARHGFSDPSDQERSLQRSTPQPGPSAESRSERR